MLAELLGLNDNGALATLLRGLTCSLLCYGLFLAVLPAAALSGLVVNLLLDVATALWVFYKRGA